MDVGFIGLHVFSTLAVIKSITCGGIPGKLDQAALFFFFLGLSATRSAAGAGQTSLLVLVLMIVAVWQAEKSRVVSGLALGLALSKYSLALPVLFYLLLRKQFGAALLSLMVQAAGLVGIWLISGSNPIQVTGELLDMLRGLSQFQGVQLSSLFPPSVGANWISGVLVTLVLFAALAVAMLRNVRMGKRFSETGWLSVLVVLCLWALLVAYHSTYDAVVFIMAVGIFWAGIQRGDFVLGKNARRAAIGLMAVSLFVMNIPGNISFFLVPQSITSMWSGIVDHAITVILALDALLFGWLLFKMGN